MNVVIPASGTAIATSVWGAATRTLSSIAAVLPPSAAANIGLAASASVSPFPGGVTIFVACFGVKASALGSMTVSFTDGINTTVVVTAAASNSAYCGPIVVESGVSATIKNNDATNSALYWYSSVNTL